MKIIQTLLIILVVCAKINHLSSQEIKEVYDIDQTTIDKILQFKGDKVPGNFTYERSNKTKGELNKLNDLYKLDVGLVIKADLSICTDGADDEYQENCLDPDAVCEDDYYRDETAHLIDGEPLDADKISYLVLPGHDIPRPFLLWNFTKGDIGVIINMYEGKNRLIFAIFGEVGPNKLIGEASTYSARKLDHCPCNEEGGLSGIPDNVYYLVFRNTSRYTKDVSQKDLNQKITELGISKMKEYFNIELK